MSNKPIIKEIYNYIYALNCSSEYIAIIDTTYRYQFANDAYLHAHNINSDIVGKHLSEIIGHDVFRRTIKPKLDLCYVGRTVLDEDWYDFKNIGYRYVKATYSPLIDDENNTTAIIINHHDFTDQKNIEEALIESKSIIEKVTITDWLTELSNRMYFDQTFPKEIKVSKRNNQFLAFAIIDIDHFQDYNHRNGHIAGDIVLKKVASTLQESLRRPNDHLFRLDSDEFALLFNVTKQEDALSITEKISKSVEALHIEHSKSPTSSYITISTGVTVLSPENNHKLVTIFKATNNLLHQAKKSGRNKVCYELEAF